MSVVRAIVVLAVLVCSVPAFGQTAPQTSTPVFPDIFSNLVRDMRQLPSGDSLSWLTAGAAGSMLVRTKDSTVGLSMSKPQFTETFESGQVIGGFPAQFGSAFALYTIGRLANGSRATQVGSDLMRAQLLAQTTSYAIKYSVRRGRPDGSSFSFPSGHTAVTFATATVLQRDLGWKFGLPAYAMASFVGASRIQAKRHYLSDVAFGAALGIVAGRTVTIGRGNTRLALGPIASPSGAAIGFSLLPKK